MTEVSTKSAKKPREKPSRPIKQVILQMRLARKVISLSEPEALTQFGASYQKHFSQIILTSWNIWKGAGEEYFRKDFLKIAQHSNLILIQEALLTPVNEKIFTSTAAMQKLFASHAGSYARQDGSVEGVMTLSKVTEARPPKRILCEKPEFLLKTFKTALETEYLLKESPQNLKVINLHARLLRGPKTAAKDVDYILEQIADHDGPLIVGGDFNTFSEGHLRTISAAMKAHNILRVPIPDDPRIKRECLDQIFIRGLKATKIKIETSIKSSDHFPVICHLEVA